MKIQGWLILLLILTLSACSSTNEDDLDQYIKEVKARKARPIEPLPTFLPPIKFSYPEIDNRRNPFKQKEVVVVITDELAPDTTRPKQRLEQFPLDALKFVGTLEQTPTIWGLISLPNGEIVRVRPGDYMGKNFGQITRITPTVLSLEETVKVAGKWQKRKIDFNLNAGK
ncbi:pilus assembly protein PilP [Legionella gresilensis]|uniref:pilus assembly protein PilP n=1 Tax=Legionella gresilensis TaxID=91823 RepID=UPI0010413CD0|nr:pilus assembly protein PilP [Legionella gresilensis]